MRELAWRWSPDIRQIDLDVNRTYRDHIMFRERYNSKQQELFNVLSAYSVYNLEIGYCQGMSQIAALLLMYLDEEEAFWALSVLLSDKKFNMHGESLKPNKFSNQYQWKWFFICTIIIVCTINSLADGIWKSILNYIMNQQLR